MKVSYLVTGLIVWALLLLLSAAVPAQDRLDRVMFLNTEDLHWGNAPPGLPAGGKFTVLLGDPSQPGPFVVRLSTSGEYVIPPHYHSRAEALTVLSGTLFLGDGTTFDAASAHALNVGGFHYLPARTPHFAFSKTPTVVEVHGDGPFDIIYIHAEDDPRNGR